MSRRRVVDDANMGTLGQILRYTARQANQKWKSVSQFGEGGDYSVVEPLATYSPWQQDAEFQRVYRQIREHTLVDIYRCHEIWQLVAESGKLPSGDCLEVGTWRGGTGALIAKQAAQLQGCETFLCDTFKGVVKTGSEDPVYVGGEHADTSPLIVQALLDGVGAKARILQGMFPEDTAHEVEGRQFRFCHIDVDVYQGAKDISNWVWPRLCSGGIVVYDDYGFLATGGVKEWVNQERALPDRIVVHNLNGHAIVIKR
jgi:O-methyltransferase